MVLAVAAADAEGITRHDEVLTARTPVGELEITELPDHHGGRLHVVDVPLDFEAVPQRPRDGSDKVEKGQDGFPVGTPAAGTIRIDYRCQITNVESAPVGAPADLIRYVRPSRYAESDKLFPTSNKFFGSLEGMALLNAVTEWVHENISYVPGSSRGTDGAVDTFLARQGICRDFAHLVVSMLRARNMPARLVAGYAPGLVPMDFHAVAEAWVDGAWHLVDATGLADMGTLARIATGADASDTAFLSTVRGGLTLDNIQVDAQVVSSKDDSKDDSEKD